MDKIWRKKINNNNQNKYNRSFHRKVERPNYKNQQKKYFLKQNNDL